LLEQLQTMQVVCVRVGVWGGTYLCTAMSELLYKLKEQENSMLCWNESELRN
jgi:hypothetical protein